MKTIKSILFVFLFSFTLFSAHASTNATDPGITLEVSLQNQISDLLLNADFWESEDAGAVFQVRFMVSTDGELVVLGTDSEDYDKAIKSLLNYEKIEIEHSLHNKTFIVPVRLDK